MGRVPHQVVTGLTKAACPAGCLQLLEAACHVGCSSVATYFITRARRGPRAGLPTRQSPAQPSVVGGAMAHHCCPRCHPHRREAFTHRCGQQQSGAVGGHLRVCPPQQEGQVTCWPSAPVWPLLLLRLPAEPEQSQLSLMSPHLSLLPLPKGGGGDPEVRQPSSTVQCDLGKVTSEPWCLPIRKLGIKTVLSPLDFQDD